MCQFDRHNQLVIARPDFIRSLDQLRCDLTPVEIDTITKVFRAPRKYVDITILKMRVNLEK